MKKQLLLTMFWSVLLIMPMPSNQMINLETLETSNIEQVEQIEQVSETILGTFEEEEKIIRTREKDIYCTDLEVTSNLRKLSNLKAYQYDNLLQGTKLEGLGNGLEEAERTYNVNGLYLLGLACLESGYGTSSFAINRNNLTGINAVDSNPNKANYFNTKDECIIATAKLLSTKYLTEGACYFNGYTPRAVDVRYCSDKTHADKIISIVKRLINEKGVN